LTRLVGGWYFRAEDSAVAKTKDPSADEPETETTSTGTAAGKAAPVPVHIGGESILDRLLPHVKKIALAVLVIALILTGVFGYRWWKDRGRAAETKSLSVAMELGWRQIRVPLPDEKPDPAAEPTYPSAKDRATAVLAQLDKGGGKGATTASYRGGLLLEAGRLDEAEATFKSASTRTDLEGVLAREGLGFVAEARAQAATDAAEKQRHLEAALAAFRAVQPDDKGLHRDYALYHEARILALLDKKADAVAALEKALEVVPETSLKSAIDDRLVLLEVAK
jgi:tetratricopeptide (TPR) repeat protein